MKIINLTVAFVAVILNSVLFAQDINFSLQDTLPKGSTMIFPSDNGSEKSTSEAGDFFVISGVEGILILNPPKAKKGVKEIEPQISHYKNRILSAKSTLNTSTPTGKAEVMTASSLNDSLIVFLSQNDADYRRCYYQYYDKSCNPISEPVLFKEHKVVEGVYGLFFCVFSENKQFFCLEFLEINLKKDRLDRAIRYEVRTRNFELVYEDDYQSLGLSPEDDFVNQLLCNDGSLLINFSRQQMDNKNKPTIYLQKLTTYQKSKNRLDKWDFDIPYKSVSQVKWLLSNKDRVLYFGGINAEKDSKSAFYVKYDLNKQKELARVSNTVNFETFMYELHELLPNENGEGVVFVLERVFGGASTSMAMNTGTVSTTPKDYFNTILCFKVEEGAQEVPWSNYFSKEQVFITSMGTSRFGSIRVFQSGNEGFIFFNDHAGNYNEQGKYIIEDDSKSEKFDGKMEKKLWSDELGLAMIQLDLASGSADRKLLFKGKGLIDIQEKNCFVSSLNRSNALFLLQRKQLGQLGQIRF